MIKASGSLLLRMADAIFLFIKMLFSNAHGNLMSETSLPLSLFLRWEEKLGGRVCCSEANVIHGKMG